MSTITINVAPADHGESLLERLRAVARRIAKFFKLSPQSELGAGLGARGL